MNASEKLSISLRPATSEDLLLRTIAAFANTAVGLVSLVNGAFMLMAAASGMLRGNIQSEFAHDLITEFRPSGDLRRRTSTIVDSG